MPLKNTQTSSNSNINRTFFLNIEISEEELKKEISAFIEELRNEYKNIKGEESRKYVNLIIDRIEKILNNIDVSFLKAIAFKTSFKGLTREEAKKLLFPIAFSFYYISYLLEGKESPSQKELREINNRILGNTSLLDIVEVEFNAEKRSVFFDFKKGNKISLKFKTSFNEKIERKDLFYLGFHEYSHYLGLTVERKNKTAYEEFFTMFVQKLLPPISFSKFLSHNSLLEGENYLFTHRMPSLILKLVENKELVENKDKLAKEIAELTYKGGDYMEAYVVEFAYLSLLNKKGIEEAQNFLVSFLRKKKDSPIFFSKPREPVKLANIFEDDKINLRRRIEDLKTTLLKALVNANRKSIGKNLSFKEKLELIGEELDGGDISSVIMKRFIFSYLNMRDFLEENSLLTKHQLESLDRAFYRDVLNFRNLKAKEFYDDNNLFKNTLRQLYKYTEELIDKTPVFKERELVLMEKGENIRFA